MWIDTRDCVPLTDGTYFVQSVYGDIMGMLYTVDGGWNTRKDAETGELLTDKAINDGYVARWCDMPKPKPIPQKWFDEYWDNRKKVRECATE